MSAADEMRDLVSGCADLAAREAIRRRCAVAQSLATPAPAKQIISLFIVLGAIPLTFALSIILFLVRHSADAQAQDRMQASVAVAYEVREGSRMVANGQHRSTRAAFENNSPSDLTEAEWSYVRPFAQNDSGICTVPIGRFSPPPFYRRTFSVERIVSTRFFSRDRNVEMIFRDGPRVTTLRFMVRCSADA